MDAFIIKRATEISTPLGLSGFTLLILFFLYRILFHGQLLSRVGKTHSFKIINRIITYLFILGILAIILGLGVYIIDKLISMPNKDIIVSEPSRRIDINSELVNYILVPSIVSPGDILRIRINSNSSRIRAFGIFEEQNGRAIKIEAKYSPQKGGIYIDYQIPMDISLGYQKAIIYVQVLQGMKEHKEVIKYKVIGRMGRIISKQDDLSKSLSMKELGFVFIPGGILKMGSNNGYADERPVRDIPIDSFWIMDHEFTVGEFKKLLLKYPELDHHNQKDFKYEINADAQEIYLMPLTLTWKLAREIASKLGKIIGREVRLPTEAEWEFAARGGLVSKDYPWGNEDDAINGQLVRDIVAKIQDHGSWEAPIHPVKSLFPPNNFKLYDIAGNVWEWTSSLYMNYPYSPSDGRENAKEDGFHVIRGGGRAPESFDIRVSLRGYARQDSIYGVRYVIGSN